MTPELFERIQWTKEQTLRALFGNDFLLDNLVLKGGTAIDLHLASTGGLGRSSKDIDFSMARDFDLSLDEVRSHFEDALTAHFSALGYIVVDVRLAKKPPKDRPDSPLFWGGYKCEFKLIESARGAGLSLEQKRFQSLALGEKDRKKFEIDISKHEYIGDEVDEYELSGDFIFMYSKTLIVAEKIRSICQQMEGYSYARPKARARDYFDICRLAQQFADEETLKLKLEALLPNVFAAKGVPLALLGAVDSAKVIAFHERDMPRLAQTLGASESLLPLPEYARRVRALIPTGLMED